MCFSRACGSVLDLVGLLPGMARKLRSRSGCQRSNIILQIICTYVCYRNLEGKIKEKMEGLRARFQIGNLVPPFLGRKRKGVGSASNSTHTRHQPSLRTPTQLFSGGFLPSEISNVPGLYTDGYRPLTNNDGPPIASYSSVYSGM